MRLGKAQLAFLILILGGAAVIALSSKVKDHPPAPVATHPQQAHVDIKAKEATTAASTTVDPVRHEDAFEMIEALKDFDASFKAAVDENREGFAVQLILRKLTEPARDVAVYDWLTTYMNEHDFLWQDAMLVHTYWSSCVTARCDQKEFKKRLAQKNGGFLTSQEVCMDSWAAMVVMTEKVQTVTVPEVHGLKPLLKQCLAKSTGNGDAVTTQLQYFLGLVQMKSDRAAAEVEYEALKAQFPEIPAFGSILPQRPE